MSYVLAIILSLGALFSCNNKDNQTPTPTPVVPDLNIQDASQAREVNDTVMTFYFMLNKSTTTDVSVDYTLQNGTAVSPDNYKAASGTITIPAHQTLAKLKVVIKGESPNLREPNLQFKILLSNPKSCNLLTTSAVGTIVTENGPYLPTDTTGYETPKTYPGYTLVWDDEFSGNQLNTGYWTPETGNGSSGWGNNELEYYTDSKKNLFVSDGNLVIEARKESYGGFNYTSSRIKTQGKKSFQYGRIDIRAKLPKGQGVWPALWMLGSNISSAGWPACGEIDILELVGNDPSAAHGTIHWEKVGGGDIYKTGVYNLTGKDFSQNFHVFSIEWKQDTIQWYVDDKLFLTGTKSDVSPANYPFNAWEFFIFNVAVGGNWPGSPDNTTVFPQRMFVDYVRVFQQN